MAEFPAPPEFWAEARSPELWRLLSQSVRGLLKGKSNTAQYVTLTAGATSTEVVLEHISADTVALLSPKTANAALSLSNVFAVTTLGKVTIFHDSSADTDRIYGIVFTG